MHFWNAYFCAQFFKIVSMYSKFKLLSVLFILLILGACKYKHINQSNVEVNNMKFNSVTFHINKQSGDTTVIAAKLAQETTCQNLSIYPNEWLHFTKDWKPEMVKISKPYQWNTLVFPTNSWLIFKGNGELICCFPNDTILNGILIKGNPKHQSSKGIQTLFDSKGNLKQLYLSEDQIIGGIPCKASIFAPVTLDLTGIVIEAKLSKEVEIKGVKWKKNSWFKKL